MSYQEVASCQFMETLSMYVPSDVNSTVHCLARPINESQTIPIKLKRRLSYKHHYQFQNVRPKKVLDAAKYLVDTSDLFKTEGIEVQNAWLNNINLQSSAHEEWSEFVENSDTLSNTNLHTQTDAIVPDFFFFVSFLFYYHF